MVKINRYVLPIMIGSLAKFCFIDLYFESILPFIMFLILLECERNLNARQSFCVGYIFGIGYFGNSLSWVHLSFNCVEMGSIGIVANILLIIYLSLYPACATCLTTFLFKQKSHIKYIFFACAWVLFEYIRGILFTGFPWNLIGYATYNIPFFKQIASIFGIYGVSLAYMLIICLIFVKKGLKYAFFIALCSIFYGGYVELFQNNASKQDDSIDVNIIQPCINQQNKLDRSMFINNLNCHLSISELEENMNDRKKIIIWPEASINTFIDEAVIGYISSHIKNDNTYIFLVAD